MSNDPIPLRDWQTIVERLDAGQCVPFLGAGVNASSEGYEGLPLGAQVALALAVDLVAAGPGKAEKFDDLVKIEVLNEALKDYPQLLRLQLQDLARVAFHLERAVDNPHLMQVVNKVLSDKGRTPSKLLTTLTRFPLRLIVTTNYDQLMERALDAAGVKYVRVVQPIAGFEPDELARKDLELAEAKANGVLILYKLHGSFPGTDGDMATPDRIIITEEDYIEFLTVVGSDQIGVPQAIKAEMTTGTLLFLGYSLEDWDFRTLFKGTIEKLQRHATFKSFAIQRRPSPFWAKFWENEKKVVIYDMNLHEFSEILGQKYDQYLSDNAGSASD